MHIKQAGGRDHNVVAAWALAAADAVRSAAEQSVGMTGGGPAAVVAIVADPGMSIGELSRALGLTHPGTVRLVDRLVEHGWVKRTRGFGRTVRLQPTSAGRRAQQRLAAARGTAMADFLAAMSGEDVRTVARLVEPVLTTVVGDLDAMRRLCRLCDRGICEPCPAERGAGSSG